MKQKIGKKNEWERFLEYEIDNFDDFIIPHNKVLVEMNMKETEKTIGGIYTVQEQNFAAHAIRRGIVKKIPERLICVLYDGSSMPWECDIDLKVGDEVYIVHRDSYNSYTFNYLDSSMKLIDYSGIVLAKRRTEIVMCNGYILLEKIMRKESFGEFSKEVEDARHAVVKAVGKPNRRIKSYDKKKKREVLIEDSQSEVNVGDKVYISDPSRVFELEHFAHARFDNRKIYKVCSRRRIGAIFD